MRKFLRPKRVANEIASGENLTSASQPSESKPDTQPNESEARGSAADHASDSNVTKVAKRSSTVAEDANIEIMSCSSDAEVDDVETPDEDQPAAYEEALDKIKATEPEAVQWLRDDTHIDEDSVVACAFYNVGIQNTELLSAKWQKRGDTKKEKLKTDIKAIFCADVGIQALSSTATSKRKTDTIGTLCTQLTTLNNSSGWIIGGDCNLDKNTMNPGSHHQK
jgi:hypothetical protein